MKTMLIPVDFTDTTYNAAAYGMEWAKAYGYERVILLKTLYNSMFDMIPSAEYVSVNEDYMSKARDEAKQKLNELCKGFLSKVEAAGIKVSIAVSELPLVRSIMELIEDEQPQLIVLGSDNINYSSNSFVAGNVITIAKISPVRVLVVPSHYRYKPVGEALAPVNFATVNTLDKLKTHSASSPQFKPKLYVLNVDPKEKYLNPDEEFKRNEKVLHEYLDNFSHELVYSNSKDIIKALVDFADTNEIQLIIALPGKHSFLYSLTHKSISEAIYGNAKHPVLILK